MGSLTGAHFGQLPPGGGSPAPGYSATVNGLAGGAPIAYWRLGSAGSGIIGAVDIPQQADWTDLGPLLVAGGPGSWDVRLSQAGTARIVKKDSTYFCVYTGADGNRVSDGGPRHYAIGVMTATNLAGPWTKYAGNPIITFRPQPTHENEEEEGCMMGDVVVDASGTFHMLWGGFTATSPTLVSDEVHYSSSTDGFTWTNNNAATAQLVIQSGLAWAGHSSNEIPVMAMHQRPGAWWVYYGPVGAIATEYGFVFTNTALPDTFVPANSQIALTSAENPLGGTFRRSSIVDRGDDQIDLITVCFDPSPVSQSSLYRRVIPPGTPGDPSTTETEFFTLSSVHTLSVYLDRDADTWVMVTKQENAGTDEPGHIWTAPVSGTLGGALILDSIGSLDGTYEGTVAAVSGLPANSDGAIDFGGSGTGSIPHNALLDLTAFTLSFWFRANESVPAGFLNPILTKDATGLEAGGFIVALEDDDTVRVEMQDGAVAHRLVSGAIEIGASHHIAVRADNTGFDAYLDGEYLGKNTGYTGAWSVNTDPIRLADATWAANDFDGTLDEIAIYDRVLTQAEVLELAQSSGGGGGGPVVPFAAGDSVGVPESTASFLIELPTGCTFVGAKADLTVTVVSQPADGDSVTVGPLNNFGYTSGAVSADTARSFTYKIEDVNGESNTATIDVLVLNAGQPVVSNANCYVISSADTVVVSSMAALTSAINAAPPGRQILIAPGTYTAVAATVNPQGTQANPIVVRPQNGRGTVTINSTGAWTYNNASAWLIVADLFFNGHRFNVFGSHHRITRCRWRAIDDTSIRLEGSRDGRFDHLDFSDYLNATVDCFEIRAAPISGGANVRNLIDHCYFHDITTPDRSRIQRMSADVRNLDLDIDVVTYDKCLFRNLNASTGGFGEIVVCKTGGYTIKFCTFENSDGYIQVRTGNNCEFRSNWFENVGVTKIFGENHLCIGNRFVNSVLWVPAGNATQAQVIAQTVPINSYARSFECQVIGNRVAVDGGIKVGEFWSTQTATLAALDNNLFENTSDAGGQAHEFHTPNSGTTTSDPGADPIYDYVPAVKLVPANVGLAAPDPYCPSGPQS